MSRKNIVIIGGGVAGLAAACRLTELGVRPMLLEAGDYPAHKICGEFLSPECLPRLASWGIVPPVSIPKASFITASDAYSFAFPQPAAGMSHHEFDPELARYAAQNGAEIRTHIKVTALRCPEGRNQDYEITLSEGETICAKSLIVATGRLPSFSRPPVMRYSGFKAYFAGIDLQATLEMYAFPGAYVGLGTVAPGTVNVAGIAAIRDHQPQDVLINELMQQHSLFAQRLSQGKMLFAEWMTTLVPEFGLKTTPAWTNAYFIGDAAGTIPPACGDGLAMAVDSGCLAAEYALLGDAPGFRLAWKQRFGSRIRWGKLLHQAMMTPWAIGGLIKASKVFPALPRYLFTATR